MRMAIDPAKSTPDKSTIALPQRATLTTPSPIGSPRQNALVRSRPDYGAP
jgi:hypothetical protein